MRGRKVKAKGQFCPRPSREDIQEEWRRISSHIPPGHYMEVTRLHYPLEKYSPVHVEYEAQWVPEPVGM